jgi:hypothetical protein
MQKGVDDDLKNSEFYQNYLSSSLLIPAGAMPNQGKLDETPRFNNRKEFKFKDKKIATGRQRTVTNEFMMSEASPTHSKPKIESCSQRSSQP